MQNLSLCERDEFKGFNYRVVLFVGSFFVSVALFNWFVNPYGIWDSPKVKGINCFIYNAGHERLYKMIMVAKRENIEVLFLGSSTVKKTLYPMTYYGITGNETYNAGFDAARISEMKKVLEQAIEFNPNLKEIVLGLNWYMFDKQYQGFAKEFPTEQIGFKHLHDNIFARILTWDALTESKNVVLNNWKGKLTHEYLDVDGKMNYYYMKNEYDNQKTIDKFVIDTKGFVPMFKKFRLSTDAMDEYASMIDLCKSHNIKLSIYINPVHAIFLESIYQSGGGEKFEEWKRQLAMLHPIYDFAHYSSVGSEPFSLQRRYWRNTQHAMPVTGDLVLRKLAGEQLSENEGEFGFLLTEDNIDAVLAKERELRSQWIEDNPKTVQFVQALVERY